VRRFLDARAERAAGRDRAKRPAGLARLASEASATTESGGEAETRVLKGRLRAAVTRSLRSGSQRSAAQEGRLRV